MSRGRAVKRITSQIRRKSHYGEVWGTPPFTELTGVTSPWSRNALGELWWEFSDMAGQEDRAIGFRAECRARDLVAEHRAAVWRDPAGHELVLGNTRNSAAHVFVQSRIPQAPPGTIVTMSTVTWSPMMISQETPPATPMTLLMAC